MWDSGPPASDPGAPTVLLLHGWTTTAALNWCRCFLPLARAYRVVAPDHRGHGRGIRSLRPFTLEDCADDAASLLRVLRTGPAVIVGYSMGGPVAQLVWRRHPEMVHGLVMCATAAHFGGSPLPPRATRAIGVGLSLAVAAIPVEVRAEGLRRLGLARDTSELAPWAVAETGIGDPAALVQAGAALAAFDSRAWIGRVDVPTAVVVTTHDTVVAPIRQHGLARSVAGAASFTVDADHRACVETADFVATLRAALELVSPRRP